MWTGADAELGSHIMQDEVRVEIFALWEHSFWDIMNQEQQFWKLKEIILQKLWMKETNINEIGRSKQENPCLAQTR